MNRSLRGVMIGVAGLALLGMSATLVSAQTVEVKEKPALYTYRTGRFRGPTGLTLTRTTPRVTRRSSHLRSRMAPSSATATMRIRCTPLKASPTTTGGRPTRWRA
jgi:hypothetical protein